jgi:TonB family protein
MPCYILAAMFSRAASILIFALCATAQSNNADKIYKIGTPGVTAAVLKYSPDPEYTKQARKKKIQGRVGLDVIIEKDGKIENVKVVRPLNPDLDANAVKALKDSQFTPCKKDGRPVRCSTYLEFAFSLD